VSQVCLKSYHEPGCCSSVTSHGIGGIDIPAKWRDLLKSLLQE
jgi:hypothetical protein